MAHLLAIGVLKTNGMVKGAADPLIHSDDALIDELGNALGKAATT